MVVTKDIKLPTDQELTVQEVNLSGSALRAGSFHLGKYCENQNNEFMLCRYELNDPRKCINEGKAVTSCTLDFFRKVKQMCRCEFEQYNECIDKSSGDFSLRKCRTTQCVFDQCMKDKLNLERPPFGYFTEARVHNTSRAKPPVEKPVVYKDATPGLPDDFEKKPARFSGRFYWLAD